MRRLSLITIALAIPLASASVCRPPKWTVGQTVQTTSGPVDGHPASVASGVSEYLGIPYAQPPVGSLRFQPPVRYNGTKKIDGKNYVSFTLLIPHSCFSPLHTVRVNHLHTT
jgi:hypothetical protein